METRMQGNRGRNTFGDILSAIGCGAKLGDAALVAVEIFRTDGAGSGTGFMQTQPTYPGGVQALPGTGGAAATPKKFPLLVQFYGYLIAGFNGTAPVFTLTETNLDDSGSVVIANIASFSANAAAGFVSIFKVLTVDKKYKLTYTPATGGPTTGEGYFFIKLGGPGVMQQTIPAVTQAIGP